MSEEEGYRRVRCDDACRQGHGGSGTGSEHCMEDGGAVRKGDICIPPSSLANELRDLLELGIELSGIVR